MSVINSQRFVSGLPVMRSTFYINEKLPNIPPLTRILEGSCRAREYFGAFYPMYNHPHLILSTTPNPRLPIRADIEKGDFQNLGEEWMEESQLVRSYPLLPVIKQLDARITSQAVREAHEKACDALTQDVGFDEVKKLAQGTN